jgi:tetratricopeptide (TPR) repeat protein
MSSPRSVVKVLCLLLFPVTAVVAQTKPDALAEYRAGNFERAVRICREEITANPNNLESHVVICWSLLRLNRLDEALGFARAGRTLSRYDARITEVLGEISFYQGRNTEALQYFQEYVNLSPEGPRIDMVYYYIGEIYIRLGRFRHADIALSTAVHWAPENAAWWTRLAYAKERAATAQSPVDAAGMGEAINAYERALALNSQLNDARRGLERAHQTLGSR